MKELKFVGNIIQQHYLLPAQRGNKLWILAQRKHCKVLHMTDNYSIEAAYNRVISYIKQSCLQGGEVYFERDYRQDRTEGLAGMHCLLTPDFYWRLDCEFTFNYQITYAFNNCAYEAEIRKLLSTYPLDRTTVEKRLSPDFNSLYNSVLAIQDPIYIHSFTR